MRCVVAALVVGLLALSGTVASAQAAPSPAPLDYAGPLPKFEVSSVRRAPAVPPPVTMLRLGPTGGDRYIVDQAPLRSIIRLVYHLRDHQIAGDPAWVRTDRFSIMAKAEGDVPVDRLELMMRSLLADRFKLRTHVEIRQFATYVLERAAPDQPLGIGVRPIDCTPAAPSRPVVRPDPELLKAIDLVPCGLNYRAPEAIRAGGITMATLANMLGDSLRENVLDRTGLAGTYSVNLDFPSTDTALAGPLPSPRGADLNSVLGAVQRHGLRLVRRNEPIEVLVIDSVDQPDEN